MRLLNDFKVSIFIIETPFMEKFKLYLTLVLAAEVKTFIKKKKE